MDRLPLSARTNPTLESEREVLHEGIPAWMHSALKDWTSQFLFVRGSGNAAEVQRAEQYLRVNADWSGAYPAFYAARSLQDLLLDDHLGLDLLDYLLGRCQRGDYPTRELDAVLRRSGSAWCVGQDHDGTPCLQRRVDPTLTTLVAEVARDAGRAGDYLRAAWAGSFGRNPTPSQSYRDAVRAVEASARPILSPLDDKATLGKMTAALRDAPAKWTFTLGDVSVVGDMMSTLWRSQHDRHGSSEESTPLNVSQSECEAALVLAVTLVAWLTSGAVLAV